MQDLVLRVPRLPLPGESLLGREFAMFAGGKGGNAAVAAARLGASPVHMIGRVGQDSFGDHIVDTLAADGVDCTFIQRDPASGTGIAVPFVFDDGENSIVAMPRANLAMTAADADAASAVIVASSVLMVQFEVAMQATAAAMRLARAAGVPVLLNPAPIAPHDPELLHFATYLVLNEVEAAAMAPGAGGDHAREAADLLARGPVAVVVTLGAVGALLATREGTVAVPPFAVQAVDSVGAGDAFCAAFALAIAEQPSGPPDFARAARFAAAAGALAVTHRGAAPSLPRRAEVEALLSL